MGQCHFETNHVMKHSEPKLVRRRCFAEDWLTAASLSGIIKKSPSNMRMTRNSARNHVRFRSFALVGTSGERCSINLSDSIGFLLVASNSSCFERVP